MTHRVTTLETLLSQVLLADTVVSEVVFTASITASMWTITTNSLSLSCYLYHLILLLCHHLPLALLSLTSMFSNQRHNDVF
jgi:hypothetical protein